MSDQPTLPVAEVKIQPREKGKKRLRRLPPYHVVLENDDYHSFEFVIEVLQKALGLDEQKAFLLTRQAHTTGRAVVWTGSKEVAELKVEQIRTFNEIRTDGTKFGPLGCTIEAAPGG